VLRGARDLDVRPVRRRRSGCPWCDRLGHPTMVDPTDRCRLEARPGLVCGPLGAWDHRPSVSRSGRRHRRSESHQDDSPLALGRVVCSSRARPHSVGAMTSADGPRMWLKVTDGTKSIDVPVTGVGGTVRVAVGERGRRSSIWTIVAGKGTSDVYCSSRTVMGVQKFSLHQSGDWRFQYTDEFLATEAGAAVPAKIIDRWPSLGAERRRMGPRAEHLGARRGRRAHGRRDAHQGRSDHLGTGA
jgi:hypothetical protein